MSARQDSQDLAGSMRHNNIRSDGIHHIHRIRPTCLPRSSSKSVGLGSKCSNGAQVDDVTTQFRQKHFLNVSAHLHVATATGSSQIIDSSHFRSEPDTAGAVDTTGHDGLDKGTNILVFDRSIFEEYMSY